MSDIRTMLRQATPSITRGIDMDTVMRKARARTVQRQMLLAIEILAVIAVLVMAPLFGTLVNQPVESVDQPDDPIEVPVKPSSERKEEPSSDAGIASFRPTPLVGGRGPRPTPRVADAVAALGLRGRLAYAAEDSVSQGTGDVEIRVMDLAAGRDTAVTDAGSEPALSPDGSRIAYPRPIGSAGLAATLHVTGSDGRGDREIFARSGARVAEPAWSPDGRRIAFVLVTQSAESWSDGYPDSGSPWGATEVRELWVVNPDGTDAHRIDAIADRFPWDPSWSPDGNRLAFSDTSGSDEVFVLDLASGRTTRIANGTNPAWAPDGRRIAVAWDFKINIVRIDDLSVEKSIQDTSHWYLSPAWSPDGEWLAFSRRTLDWATTTNSKEEVFVVRPDGRDLTVVLSGTTHYRQPSWAR